ncbi:MAG: hypothetical protein MUF54_20290 [Polyangiaceae bacterium]|nr:hypothetical protein [Polyangiaceae bacterium]
MKLLTGCPDGAGRTNNPEDAGRSPNAALRPPPLGSSATTSLPPADASTTPVGIPGESRARLILPDAGVPAPRPMLPGARMPPDSMPNREAAGMTLEAEWRWSHLPAPAPGPEVANPGIDRARKLTRHLWQIEIAETGRMRIVFDAPSFPLPKFTELRARNDYYGHAMVWPNAEAYRVVPPGALRALLDERRVDVTPLVAGKITPVYRKGTRHGFPTRSSKVTTPWGSLTLEQLRAVNVSEGGQLLCRLLVELVGVDPACPVCEHGKMPVYAVFSWNNDARLEFDVTGLLIRSDFPSSLFMIPPTNAPFGQQALPPIANGIFLTREELNAFRHRAVPPPVPRTDDEAVGAPGEGFIAVNNDDAPRYLLLDGVAVAWIPAHGEQYLIGTKPGRYNVQWRSFLGSYLGSAITVQLPGRLHHGAPSEAGAPAQQ